MTHTEVRCLLWGCLVINYGVLILWFGVFALAHDGLYRLHTRWFRLSPQAFEGLPAAQFRVDRGVVEDVVAVLRPRHGGQNRCQIDMADAQRG